MTDPLIPLDAVKLIERVLEEVNLARVLMGLPKLCELEKGKPSVAEECPIAMSLGDDGRFKVGRVMVEFKNLDDAEACAKAWGFRVWAQGFDRNFPHTVCLPQICQNFVARFDDQSKSHGSCTPQEELELKHPLLRLRRRYR